MLGPAEAQYVRGAEPRGGPEGPGIDFSFFRPGATIFARELDHALIEMGRTHASAALQDYQPDGGSAIHREAGAVWINRYSGVCCEADRVLVCGGTHHSLSSVVMALAQPGDLVLTEELTYTGLKSVTAALKLRLHGLAIDEHGLVPEAFEVACKTLSPRALVCVPNYHNPTTATLPLSRRIRIAEIATAHNVPVIEDDVYGPLLGNTLPAIASFLPDLGYLVTGVSKTLSPGLRIGFALAPAALVGQIAAMMRATTFMASPLTAEIVSRWIRDGAAERIIRAGARDIEERQAIAGRILSGIQYVSAPTCPHLWIPLPAPWRADEFVRKCRTQGVSVLPADAFAAGRIDARHGVRLMLACGPDRTALERGLGLVREVLKSDPEPAYAVP